MECRGFVFVKNFLEMVGGFGEDMQGVACCFLLLDQHLFIQVSENFDTPLKLRAFSLRL